MLGNDSVAFARCNGTWLLPWLLPSAPSRVPSSWVPRWVHETSPQTSHQQCACWLSTISPSAYQPQLVPLLVPTIHASDDTGCTRLPVAAHLGFATANITSEQGRFESVKPHRCVATAEVPGATPSQGHKRPNTGREAMVLAKCAHKRQAAG